MPSVDCFIVDGNSPVSSDAKLLREGTVLPLLSVLNHTSWAQPLPRYCVLLYTCLGDSIQASVVLVESAGNDIIPLGDEGKWESPYPVHDLAPVTAESIFNNIYLGDHGILHANKERNK